MKKLHQNAFTLIELLVVIAIISLLVSILLPSLNKAKELAKTVVCSSNVKAQISTVFLYAGDYDGLLPKSAYWENMTAEDKLYNTLPGNLFAGGYVDSYMLFYCSESKREIRDDITELKNWILKESYGFSTEFFSAIPLGSGYGPDYFDIGQIEASSSDVPSTVMIADSVGYCLDTGKGGGDHGSPDSHWINPFASAGSVYFRGRARHNGGLDQDNNAWTMPTDKGGTFNFGFADGHVEQVDELEFLGRGYVCGADYFVTQP